MKICILTFGTRGDVQPYVALGRGLKAAGHEVTIATLVEFRSLVIDYGLQHDTLRGDFLKAAQAAERKSALEGEATRSGSSGNTSKWRGRHWRMNGPALKKPMC